MNARARLRDGRPTRKPRIYAALPNGRGGYWVERFAKDLEVEYAGTFDEAVGIVNDWTKEAAA